MRPDRHARKIHGEAVRLAMSGECEDACDIESRLVAMGFADASEMLRERRGLLDGACRAAKRPKRIGILGMFIDGGES